MAEIIQHAGKTDVTKVRTDVVACAGEGTNSGHPQVWLRLEDVDMDGREEVVCPYCSKVFIRV